MLSTTLLLLALQFPAQARPGRAPQPAPPRYDSTRMDLRGAPGVSNKAVMQAASTYGKIGAGQPLNHADSVFLRTWSPGYLGAPDAPKAPARRAKH